ncbi:MAG: hypothetical protein ACTHK8_02475 [Ginsengibacter sp.]|jgi:hypothetical protein
MKKYYYLLSSILILTLTSFVILKTSPHTKISPKKEMKICGTCSTPNALGASLSYNTLTLTWSNSSNGCNVVGYVNYDSLGQGYTKHFQLLNVYSGTKVYFVNPSSTSVEFSVTQICGDGTYSQSTAQLIYL